MDISNRLACLAAIFVALAVYAMQALGIPVFAGPLLVFCIIGLLLVFIKNYLDSRRRKQKVIFPTSFLQTEPNNIASQLPFQDISLSREDSTKIRASEIDRLTALIKAVEDKMASRSAIEWSHHLNEVSELLDRKKQYLSELDKLKCSP